MNGHPPLLGERALKRKFNGRERRESRIQTIYLNPHSHIPILIPKASSTGKARGKAVVWCFCKYAGWVSPTHPSLLLLLCALEGWSLGTFAFPLEDTCRRVKKRKRLKYYSPPLSCDHGEACLSIEGHSSYGVAFPVASFSGMQEPCPLLASACLGVVEVPCCCWATLRGTAQTFVELGTLNPAYIFINSLLNFPQLSQFACTNHFLQDLDWKICTTKHSPRLV